MSETTAPRRPAPPVRRHTQLSDDAARYIRDLIMSGYVKGGDYLRVEHIAQEMGISVTPVREALASLRGEGFVVQEPRRGFVVLPIRARDIRDLFDEQARLAGELAARAVEAISNEDLGALGRTQDQLEAATKRGDHETVLQLNFDFHRRINMASDSRKLAWILRTIVRFSPNRVFSEMPGWDAASSVDHRAIIAAFDDRDPEKARGHMAEHIDKASSTLMSYLEERGTFTSE